MKKKPFITVETENLAVPEVHIDKEDVEETTDTDTARYGRSKFFISLKPMTCAAPMAILE